MRYDEANKPDGDKSMSNSPINNAGDSRVRQRLMGKELRRWYDSVVTEPVPADLLDLLIQLDERESKGG
jgi:hypothetical protein